MFLTSQRMPSRYALHLQYHTLSIILPHKNSTNTVICEDILMRCAVNSIFDCAGVLATPYNLNIKKNRFYRSHYLRGIFDEKRLDEIF